MKKCSVCQQFKDLSLFSKNKKSYDGAGSMCRKCANEYSKLWRKNNEEKVKAYKERYSGRYNGRYKISYSDKKDYFRKYYREKRSRDSLFVLKNRYRNRLWCTLNKKSNSSLNILGCQWDELLVHLLLSLSKNERIKYLRDNKDYHIDHIIPLASAECDEDFLILNHYTNLQLLKAEDNIRKGSRW